MNASDSSIVVWKCSADERREIFTLLGWTRRSAAVSRHARKRVCCSLGCVVGCLLVASLFPPHWAGADHSILLLPNAPRGELAIVQVDFSSAVARGDLDPALVRQVHACRATDGAPIKVQFVPESAIGPVTKGTLVLKLPPGSTTAIRLAFDRSSSDEIPPAGGPARTSDCTIKVDAQHSAGLPYEILFERTQKAFRDFRWNDRLHHAELGGFHLSNDKQAKVEFVSEGPLCTVVRMEAAYKRDDGTQPATQPRAVYDWYYFKDSPVVYVTAAITQESPYRWTEVHFLELNFPGRDFTHWIGSQSAGVDTLLADSRSHRDADWAAVVDDKNGIGMFGCGSVLVHDGRGQYGTYLHAEGDRSWEPWDDTRRRYCGWLWIGTADDPREAIQSWQQRLPIELPATLTTQSVHAAIETAQQNTEQLAQSDRQAQRWNVAVATRLESAGRLESVHDALQGKLPTDWHMLEAGVLRAAFQCGGTGVQLASLFDAGANHEHLAAAPLPLFRITLRNAETKQLETITAQRGWQHVTVERTTPETLSLHWRNPDNQALGALAVTARAQADAANSAVRWQLSVSGQSAPWSLWRVVFPQLEVIAPGNDSVLLIPRGPGEEQHGVWQRAFTFQGVYPSGWMSMQFMAAYDRQSHTGLYWAIHDPMGGTKDLSAKSLPSSQSLVLAADMPVPDMGQPGNGFQLSGEAVWQAFAGDWFDAAVIYRNWVRQHARWYPSLGHEGRADTPAWMRELCVWAQTGGTAAACANQVQRFAEFLGVPVGFHWYSWHQIPFDNDYPHYFPPADDFAEGVRKLHESNVYVMPYINGRLWDTRDQGTQDSEFTRRALPAATKDENGAPYTEAYGSKESDGSPVRLAVMCPATATWQDEVNGIVAKLFDEYGVDGVYIDQIAAAPPVTCLDATHGHLLGGGHWWNEGYWQMLQRMRGNMKPDRMLTTECNAEPFLKWFDGYLTWHWQYDGQVPAFPAIYGGAIQMFGRAYRGGETQDLALRMKSAQQLVFGEQIGWISPGVVDQPDNAEFLRQVVRLRWQLRRYFHAGEMLRPPKLIGDIPRVRADWQWADTWWVETDGVLTGSWRLPHEASVVVILANVTDQAVPVQWSFDAAKNDLPASHLRIARISSEGAEESAQEAASFMRHVDLPPRTAWAWEITPAPDKE